MLRGDVVTADLGAAQGRAQAGTRPGIVWQAPVPAGFPTVVLIPLTGSQGAARFHGTVAVAPDSGNGLTMPSIALCFQITAVDRRDIIRTMGTLSKADMEAVEQTLRAFLMLP